MRRNLLIKFIGLSFLIPFLFFFLYRKEKIIVNSTDEQLIENFDLILTKGQSVQSKLLNLSNLSELQEYTHVGLVCKSNNHVSVLHATPDGTKENSIRYDNFQDFIDLSNACGYRIMRYGNMTNEIRKLIQTEVEKYKNSKIPFDYEFNNKESNNIYCSELIFLIYTESKAFKKECFNLKKPIDPNLFLSQTDLVSITERN